jgi:hypothetical protein
MSTTFVPRAPSVLKRVVAEQPRRPAAAVPATAGRSFQVLQNSRAPAQLSLFLRPGAVDVK